MDARPHAPHTGKVQTRALPSAPRVAILVPTTGGPARIASLVRRPRLARSMVTSADDFRPLPIAESYHRLVEGPLAGLDEAPTHWHLTLTARVETGRSWELPVLLAHRALARGAVLADLHDADIVLWASGAVDGALDPAGAARHLREKLVASADALAAAGARTRFIIAADAPERGHLAAAAEASGAPLVEVARFADIERALDLALGPAPSAAPSAAPPTARPAARGGVRWWTLARAAIGIAAAAAIAFGASILVGDPEPAGGMITMEQLTAADRTACIDAAMSGAPLTARRLGTDGAGDIAIAPQPATCALRFTPRGGEPVTLSLDEALRGTLLPGDSPVGRALTVVNGTHHDLVFRTDPAGRATTLTLRRGATTQRLTIRFLEGGR